MRLRSHLVALVLAVLVPMMIATAIVIALLGKHQRAAAERGAIETARALVHGLDEILHSSITTLEAVASTHALQVDDLRAFDAIARRVLTTQSDWYDIILMGREATTLVDTQFSYGTPARLASEPASVHDVVTSGRRSSASSRRARVASSPCPCACRSRETGRSSTSSRRS